MDMAISRAAAGVLAIPVSGREIVDGQAGTSKLMTDDSSSSGTDEQEVIRVTTSAFSSTTFIVRDFSVREQMGRPFLIEVQLVCDDASLVFTTVLGTHLTLEIDLP